MTAMAASSSVGWANPPWYGATPRDSRAERQADQGRDADRRQTDRQGEADNGEQRRVGAQHKLKGGGIGLH
jgi:hypothetical protein